VKPENIMFYHGTACLADFGVARAIEEMDAGLTVHGAVVGTPAYMSPEQYAAAGFDGRSDVYSLSCVLFEMIAGARLYAGSTVKEVLAERDRPPSIRKLRPTIPESVDDLLARGLAQNPEDRFADAHKFVAAIDAALKEIQAPPVRISAPRRAIGTVRRHKVKSTVAALVIAASAGFAWPPYRHYVTRFPDRLRADVAPGARRAFVDGRVALDNFDIPTAQRELAAAVAADPTAPVARLWHAQSFILARQMGTEAFRLAALRLGAVASQLGGRDSLLADALVKFAMVQPAAACDSYHRLIQRDSLDVLAWYGLGDCNKFDSSVVRDPRSPSGWRFSSSYYSAARAYMRAVTLRPEAHSAFPYDALTTLLPSDVAYVRFGRTNDQPRQAFAAYASLAGDTIAFVPYPIAAFASSGPATLSPTLLDALRRNRDMLLSFARQWTQASPRSLDAWEALALAREGRGELTDGEDGMGSALVRARSLAATPVQRTRLAAATVRMRVKRGEFAAARALADSTLALWRGQSPPREVAVQLAGLAALTGRVELGATLRTTAWSERMANMGVAPPLFAAANRFFNRAAPGVCDDTLAAARRDFERALMSYATPARRDQVRQTALGHSPSLAYSCLRAAAFTDVPAQTPLDRAQRAYDARDTRRARSVLDSLARLRAIYRPGDISLDYTVQESWLRAATGDTVGAVQQLDLVLDALPTLSALSVREDAQSAAVGRAMTLRADFAAAQRDSAVARRWASNVVDLWSGADPALAPTLARMRRLSGR